MHRTKITTSFEMKPGTMFREDGEFKWFSERQIYVVMGSVSIKVWDLILSSYKNKWVHELRLATEYEKTQFEAVDSKIIILSLGFEVKPKTILRRDNEIYLIIDSEYHTGYRDNQHDPYGSWMHEARTLTEKEYLIHEVMES